MASENYDIDSFPEDDYAMDQSSVPSGSAAAGTHSSDEEDGVTVTPQEALEQMRNALSNEILSPDILPHCGELVECLESLMGLMKRNIELLDKTDFAWSLCSQELSRTKFTVVSYLRTRLEKIERFSPYYFTSPGMENELRGLLTAEEFNFAKSVWDLTKEELTVSALDHLPRIFREIKPDMLPKPNLNRFVFFRANQGCPDVLLDPEDDEPTMLEENSLHLTRYGPIGGLLKTGRVQLI